jgi:ADP-ribose pyrophosphatase
MGGKEFGYFLCTRGEDVSPPEDKKPEAVVIVAVVDDGKEKRLVVTSEARPAIGCRELSFPAGLIDDDDYEDGVTIRDAACKAAIREMKEETGLTFAPTAVSPNNLYSSAGMTDESVIIVFGMAQGTPSDEDLEAGEDIETMLITWAEMVAMMDAPCFDFAYGKTAWPFMWGFKFMGGFTKGFPDDPNARRR